MPKKKPKKEPSVAIAIQGRFLIGKLNLSGGKVLSVTGPIGLYKPGSISIMMEHSDLSEIAPGTLLLVSGFGEVS